VNQIEADLQASAIRAEAARLAMSRLLVVAGHDLKQPLQIAFMAIARVASEVLRPCAAARLEIALDALNRLGSELDDLARSSFGEAELKPHLQTADLTEIFRDVERDWRVYADACGVGLCFQPSGILVKTDGNMLRTILRNLVGNAVKYSGPGGRVIVSCMVHADEVTIQIHDNGCGIAPAGLSTIFDAFERGDWTGRGEGLGLGLHIVQQTAHLLGHPVSVRSVQGQGSVFSVTVPRETTAADISSRVEEDGVGE
jgi:signal transduction histidine kinase